MKFLEELKQQRWDDHRFYHHSRINQSLHLLSAISFLTAYFMLTVNTIAAATIGWLVAMCSRQIGHFFFEPKDYDIVNQATHEYKEKIKVGYNLRRKLVLMSLWAISPLVLYYNPDIFGMMEQPRNLDGFIYNLSIMWLVLGSGALVFCTIQLFFINSVQTGLVWATKILTDPFHDIMLYHKAPLYLMKGEIIDPMVDVHT